MSEHQKQLGAHEGRHGTYEEQHGAHEGQHGARKRQHGAAPCKKELDETLTNYKNLESPYSPRQRTFSMI